MTVQEFHTRYEVCGPEGGGGKRENEKEREREHCSPDTPQGARLQPRTAGRVGVGGGGNQPAELRTGAAAGRPAG